ncbi:MAG: hypothetical protein PVG03_10810 [Desulfarculaceae bacterium]
MAVINGVLGPLNTADLGFTLMHEHIYVGICSMRAAFPDWLDQEALIERAVRQVMRAKKYGVRTIVESTPCNLGREIEIIRAVAQRSGVNFIAATGLFWTEEPWLRFWETERIVGWLRRDIEEGIQGGPCKAGVIKCATDHPGITETNKKLLQVAARLHRETGVPISTHTTAKNRSALQQQDVLEAEGVDLRRVLIGHCGDCEDIAYLEQILSRGSIIGMDRFGADHVLDFERRVAVVAELCKRGWASQMVLSQDYASRLDWFTDQEITRMAPNWSYHLILERVIPALKLAGVNERQICQMTVLTPRTFFEQQDVY